MQPPCLAAKVAPVKRSSAARTPAGRTERADLQTPAHLSAAVTGARRRTPGLHLPPSCERVRGTDCATNRATDCATCTTRAAQTVQAALAGAETDHTGAPPPGTQKGGGAASNHHSRPRPDMADCRRAPLTLERPSHCSDYWQRYSSALWLLFLYVLVAPPQLQHCPATLVVLILVQAAAHAPGAVGLSSPRP